VHFCAGVEEMSSLSKKELMSMLRFGADRIFAAAEGRPPSDAELDDIIHRSHNRAAAAGGFCSRHESPSDCLALWAKFSARDGPAYIPTRVASSRLAVS